MGQVISVVEFATLAQSVEVIPVDRRNARFSVWNAAAAAVSLNLINPYVGIFAVYLGADNMQLGYLNSWPQAASVAAVLLLASTVGQSPRKQAWTAGINLVGRTAALGAAAVPWFPPTWRIWALILFWVLSVFPYSVGTTTQNSFLADIFPAQERGRAFAARNSWSTAAGMITVLLAGWALDHLFPYPLGYQLIFFGSFAAGVLEIFLFLRLRSPEASAAPRRGESVPHPLQANLTETWQTYAAVFRHQPFLVFVLCSIPFHFTWQMAWPIFTRFQVTDLGMDNTWMSLVTVANSLSAVIAYPFLARKAERVGNLRMLAESAVNLALAPVLTAICPSAVWVAVINLYTGIGVAGVNLFVLNCLLDIAPEKTRAGFLAVHAALVSASAAIAPLVGAYLMTAYTAKTALIISTFARSLTACGFFLLLYRQRQASRKTQAAPRFV